MKVAMLTIGSCGDVQPFVALGIGLREAGHEVTVATGGAFEAFVVEHGLRFAALDVGLLERLQSPEGKAALSGKKFLATLKETASMYRRGSGSGMGGVEGGRRGRLPPQGPGRLPRSRGAERTGLPRPPHPDVLPNPGLSDPVLPAASLGGSLNRLSYGAFLRISTASFHRTINRWREETLGLPPRGLLASELELRGEPVSILVGCSPHVVPPPADWGPSTTMTGYWFLDGAGDWRPPAHLAAFLEDGPPPVYVGFGSLGGWTSEEVVGAALAALERAGKRGVLATGGVPLRAPDNVCVIESAPHEWLFPRMAAVVHHGGAGTTAEGLRAGKPTVICPTTLNDQLFWGRRVRDLGVGPEPIPQKKLTAETLLRAIKTSPEDGNVRERAVGLGERIRAERGVARAVEVIGSAAR